MNINKVILLGRLATSPDLKYFQSGHSLMSFYMAVHEDIKSRKTGKWKQHTHYVRVKAWGRKGELIAENFRKGEEIYIEGKLTYESWKNDEDKTESRVEVTVMHFKFPNRKRRE